MPIKAKCDGCGAGFKAKDSLAGKRVKCPKCQTPLTIPGGDGQKPAMKGRVSAGSGAIKRQNPAQNAMLDLLDEANVKAESRGPICENCAADLTPGAIICVECGFNQQTGKRLATTKDEEAVSDRGMTDAERLLAKAEKDIEESPVTSDDQDFGDGADSFVIAGVAGAILLVLVGIGLTIIFSMEWISHFTNPGAISFTAAIFMALGCVSWITWVAFKQNSVHGIVCLCTVGLWCIVYGFMQGKELLLPTIILIFSFVVLAGAGAYVSYNGFGPAPVN